MQHEGETKVVACGFVCKRFSCCWIGLSEEKNEHTCKMHCSGQFTVCYNEITTRVDCFIGKNGKQNFLCPLSNCYVRGSSIESLENHCTSKHGSQKEKEQKWINKRRKQAYCDVCWLIFKTQASYKLHKEDKTGIHQQNIVRFIRKGEGRHCFLCHVNIQQRSSVKEHETRKKHLNTMERKRMIMRIHQPNSKSARK